MIGSHDTFTYLKPTNPIFNLFKRYWKCQEIDIDKQYELGVRCFDIRVFRNYKKYWQICHGVVNFDKEFVTIYHLCHTIEKNYPNAIYRIVLEKGNGDDMDEFYNECLTAHNTYKNFWRAVVGDHWLGVEWEPNWLEKYPALKLQTWEAPNHELNGKLNVNPNDPWYKKIYNLIFKYNIKKGFLELTKGEEYMSENNINNPGYIILSDYVNLLK